MSKRGAVDPKQVLIAGYEARCEKIIKDLIGQTHGKLLEFDVDFKAYPEYKPRIPCPISFSGIRQKLKPPEKPQNSKISKYLYLNDFATDIRRVYGNFVRYNYYANETKFRRDGLKGLYKFEQLWFALHSEIEEINSGMKFKLPLPELRFCLQAFDEVVKIPSSIVSSDPNGQPFAVDSFINPIHCYFSGDGLKQYLKIVKQPISIGEIISKLVEAEYETLDQFVLDIDLLVDNCSTYWSMEGNVAEGGKEYIKDALTLQSTFIRLINQEKEKAPNLLMPRVDSSRSSPMKSPADHQPIVSSGKIKLKVKQEMADAVDDAPATLSHPASAESLPPAAAAEAAAPGADGGSDSWYVEKRADKWLKVLLKMCLGRVRDHYMMGAIKVSTALPFLKGVDPLLFPDYSKIILYPMDLAKMDKKFNSDRYTYMAMGGTPSAASSASATSNPITAVLQDMTLIRDNAHAYNEGQEGLEVRIMATALLNYFKYLLTIGLQHILSVDPAVGKKLTAPPVVQELLQQPVAEDVTKYLTISGVTRERLLEQSGLLKGVTASTSSASLSAAPGAPAVPAPKKMKEVKIEALLPSPPPAAASNKKQKTSKNQSATNAATIQTDTGMGITEAMSPTSKKKAKGGKSVAAGAKRSADAAALDFYPDEEALMLPPAKVRLPWEEAADSVMRQLLKHAYIDPTKPTVIANFLVPLEHMPAETVANYTAVVKNPMDLTTLRMRLDDSLLTDVHEFYQLLMLVFQNALAFQQTIQNPFTEALVKRCNILIQYVHWLCLETLPLEDDTTDASSSKKGKAKDDLRVSVQAEERKKREDILKSAGLNEISSPLIELKKLLKDLERCRTNPERLQLSYFLQPVNDTLLSDYSVYVRSPIDLSTIKYKLEGVLPSVPAIAEAVTRRSYAKYKSYWEVVQDIQRVFSNALKYNKVHLTSDSTGMSKNIYEAAETFQQRLDALLGPFTLQLVDRLQRLRLIASEDYARDAERRRKYDLEQQEARQFEQKVLEDRKKEDSLLAADLDMERKRLETELQMKAHFIAQQRNNLGGQSGKLEDLVRDVVIEEQTSPLSASGAAHDDPMRLNKQQLELLHNKTGSIPIMRGFGMNGRVPARYNPSTILMKHQVLRKARAAWSAHAITSGSAATSSGGSNTSAAVNGAASATPQPEATPGDAMDVVTAADDETGAEEEDGFGVWEEVQRDCAERGTTNHSNDGDVKPVVQLKIQPPVRESKRNTAYRPNVGAFFIIEEEE